MTEQEIKQLKVISLNTASGNVDNAKAIYDWLIQKTDNDGKPIPPPVTDVPKKSAPSA